jgi:hypothetical protein
MAETKVANIIVPEVFLPYMIEESIKKSALIRAGIVVPDPRIDILANSGGTTVNMPFFKDLTGASQVLSDSADLTVSNITTGQDIARIHPRGNAWGVNDLAQALSGDDPMAAIASLVAGWKAADEQAMLIASLEGVFASNAANNSSDLIHTAASESIAGTRAWNDTAPTVMNPIAILDAAQLLGDASGKFTALVMHSKCYTDLLKQELIDYIVPSDGSSRISMYLDKEVIVDDLCPTRDGTTDGTDTVYQSFLFGRGAVARGDGQAPVPVETDRQALSSNDILIIRNHTLLHPRGFAWQESSIAGATTGGGPTNLEMAEAAQWTRVYESKNTRCVMIETN